MPKNPGETQCPGPSTFARRNSQMCPDSRRHGTLSKQAGFPAVPASSFTLDQATGFGFST